MIIKIRTILLLSILQAGQITYGQKPSHYSSAEILHRIQKLNVLGNVLYIAAHPDDENTAMITYMANEMKVNAAYFSFTRGDGGQNLIGPEFGDQLGVIRTQELLAARRTDRGSQYFSRAIDFGYSKHPDETFAIWNKQEVLGDLVWIIRKFRPDIMITRFNPVPGNNHGHHTASAILAAEAFDLAADPKSYPEQLTFVKPWQAKTLYWNTSPWFRSDYQKDTAELLSVDIGKFNQVLGMSYSEIAAISRSNHKSQGFGSTGTRGLRQEYLQHEKGVLAKTDIFEVTDLSWGRVKDGTKIQNMINQLLDQYDAKKPSSSLQRLLDIRKSIQQLKDEFWKEIKTAEIDELIAGITGLYLEVSAPEYYASPGDSISLQVEAINRSDAEILIDSVVYSVGKSIDSPIVLKNNAVKQFKLNYLIPNEASYSQPYWLAEKHGIGLVTVKDRQSIGMAESKPAIEVFFYVRVNGEIIQYHRPVVYKRNDPVDGETYRPFIIVPPAFVNLSNDVALFPGAAPLNITAEVRSGKNKFSGKLSLSLPDTWKVVPLEFEITQMGKGESRNYEFTVTPPENQQTTNGVVELKSGGKVYTYGISEIKYPHIPTQTLLPESAAKFVKLDINVGDEKIGYIAGPGDDVPVALRQLGYTVDIINNLEFTNENLDRYNVIILGVRALNTEERLRGDLTKLFSFVERGGKLIVQYNTAQALVNNQIAPYSLQLSRNRVTDEKSAVVFLQPEHAALNYPNKITEKDFEGWVQERGLYFPGQRAPEFIPLVSMGDKGEAPLDGGILIADYGKGKYIHTSLSWFRQLPAGIPGAYRLFVNLISLK